MPTEANSLNAKTVGLVINTGTSFSGTSITQYDVLVGAASNAISSIGPGTTQQLLVSGGSGANPSYKALSLNVQVFTYTGSPQTYTPTSGMVYCNIECVGGGGGAGGTASTASNVYSAGGGGGGGGYSRKFASSTTIGASQTVTVGAGGSGGSAGNNSGSSGGTTSVGVICTAPGGAGGAGNNGSNSSAGGGGGGIGTGDFSIPGQPGGNSISTAAVGVIPPYGAGGSSILGFGAVANTTTGAVSGIAGGQYGGGGSSGGSFNNIGATAGGFGAPGIVIVTEYVIS